MRNIKNLVLITSVLLSTFSFAESRGQAESKNKYEGLSKEEAFEVLRNWSFEHKITYEEETKAFNQIIREETEAFNQTIESAVWRKVNCFAKFGMCYAGAGLSFFLSLKSYDFLSQPVSDTRWVSNLYCSSILCSLGISSQLFSQLFNPKGSIAISLFYPRVTYALEVLADEESQNSAVMVSANIKPSRL